MTPRKLTAAFWIVVTLVQWLGVVGCRSAYDRPPLYEGLVGAEEYDYCPKCGSLTGGMHIKGPRKSFDGPGKHECIHEWEKITFTRFKELAVEKHDFDWSKEPAHFWRTTPDSKRPVEAEETPVQ